MGYLYVLVHYFICKMKTETLRAHSQSIHVWWLYVSIFDGWRKGQVKREQQSKESWWYDLYSKCIDFTCNLRQSYYQLLQFLFHTQHQQMDKKVKKIQVTKVVSPIYSKTSPFWQYRHLTLVAATINLAKGYDMAIPRKITRN